MAKPISDEELQLRKRARRRLIGAVVLVTAVVIVLPMVLDSEPRTISHDIDIRIPSPESGVFKSKVVPAAPLPESRTATKSPPVAKADAGASIEKPQKVVAAAPSGPAAKPEPAPAPAPKEATKSAGTVKPAPKAQAPEQPAAPTAKPANGKFVIQVIALADAEKARAIQKQIAATGVGAYTEVVKTAKGDVTRVRAGPFPTREAAEKAQEKLKAAGFDGKVAPR